MSTLQTIVAKFRPASPNIALAFDEVERRLVAVETAVPAPVPTPTPTPAPTAGPLFGFCKDVAAPATAYSTREFQEMVACAGPETVARVDYWTNGTQGTVLPAADTAGVRNLLLVVGGEMHSVPDPATYAALAVKVAKERPTAILEWGNEPGIHGWAPADCVRVWDAAQAAIRAAGCTNLTTMGSMAGGERQSAGKLGPQQWCKELVAAGARVGKTFDLPNFHVYGDLVRQEQQWLNYWTPDPGGSSCVKILGATRFALTEFGSPLGSLGGNEQSQAAQMAANVKILKATPGLVVATQYAMSDDVYGTSSGYGLVVPAESWRRRPAWDSFRAALVTT